MGENGLEIIFGETVKNLVFEKAEKSTRKNNKHTSTNLDFHYFSLLFTVFVTCSYIFLQFFLIKAM